MGKTRRKKKHTHVAASGPGVTGQPVPSTFVMEHGKVGSTLSRLVADLRQMMEPHTASKLKVRRRNVLKDFVAVAGPLGVTHFIVVSLSKEFINIKFCRLPRGPTITFHLKSFCLCSEVVSNLKKPTTIPGQFLTPPLLVLNNFAPDSKPCKLIATMLQNMLPSITVQTVKLAEIRRCVMFHFDSASSTVELRHYNIKATPRGTSRGVRKLARSRSHVPNLSGYTDISDFVLSGPGEVSESEGEEMAGEGDVTLPQDLPGRGNIKAEQSAIRLTEIGPRLTMQLVKIESGLCDGEVLHHQFVSKTRREARDQRRRVQERRQLKETRKRQQEANVLRKKQEQEQHREKCMAGQKRGLGKQDSVTMEDKGDASSYSSDDDDDDDLQWYREEVGEEPDPDVFLKANKRKRSSSNKERFLHQSKRRKTERADPETATAYRHNKQAGKRSYGQRPSEGPQKMVRFTNATKGRTRGGGGKQGKREESAGKGRALPVKKAGRVFRRSASNRARAS